MDLKELEFVKEVIAEGKLSKPEDDRPHPKVGALLIHEGKVVKAHRGEIAEGDHAEYTLLERKVVDIDVAGAILFTTLEPCTCRNHPKSPCATRVISRRVKKVYVGMLDPNPDIYGKGVLALRKAGIDVEMFPVECAAEIRSDNQSFVESYLSVQPGDPGRRGLDDWYHTVNSIYFNSNFYRGISSIFTHLVEIMGGLSLLATNKIKAEVSTEAFLAKAIAWWMALCGKMGIRSAEELLWSKFPYLCPYCRRLPHDQDLCSESKAKNKNPDWQKLHEVGQASVHRIPKSLGAWQRMFGQIYTTSQTEKYDTVFGRFTEELGELAEAVRIGPVMHGYFISEAADVFAWLMKLTNIYEAEKRVVVGDRGKMLEEVMYQQYPDKCRECGRAVCNCPPLLSKTLGRIAHDGPDPTLLKESGQFMSPAEAASFFEIGSKQIAVGNTRIIVTASVIEEARAISKNCRVLTESQLPDVIFRQLRAIANSIDRKCDAEAVHEHDILNLLRTLVVADEASRTLIIELITRNGRTALVDAIIGQTEAATLNN